MHKRVITKHTRNLIIIYYPDYAPKCKCCTADFEECLAGIHLPQCKLRIAIKMTQLLSHLKEVGRRLKINEEAASAQK